VNICKELFNDLGITAIHGDLTRWQSEGVFLLNRVLTTAPNVSQGHANIGWQDFTKQVVEYLAKRPIVFILWGRSAGELVDLIPEGQVIQGVHPSPLSAYRGFFGSKPFSAANEKLRALGISEIDWSI
jgi:uracil-DNA glycosylase